MSFYFTSCFPFCNQILMITIRRGPRGKEGNLVGDGRCQEERVTKETLQWLLGDILRTRDTDPKEAADRLGAQLRIETSENRIYWLILNIEYHLQISSSWRASLVNSIKCNKNGIEYQMYKFSQQSSPTYLSKSLRGSWNSDERQDPYLQILYCASYQSLFHHRLQKLFAALLPICGSFPFNEIPLIQSMKIREIRKLR